MQPDSDQQTQQQKRLLAELYYGRSGRAVLFRYGLLVMDMCAVAAFGVAFVLRHLDQPEDLSFVLSLFENAVGILVLADLAARMFLARDRLRYFSRGRRIADALAGISFLAPGVINLGFLKIFRLVRSAMSLRAHGRILLQYEPRDRNEKIFLRVVNLVVFVFAISEIVYELQFRTNPDIKYYTDALYFTVVTLTTTGFGDITLPGTGGKWLSIVIMVIGITLFFRLIRAIFETPHVAFACPRCGLEIHQTDAQYCRRCGAKIAHDRERQE